MERGHKSNGIYGDSGGQWDPLNYRVGGKTSNATRFGGVRSGEGSHRPY